MAWSEPNIKVSLHSGTETKISTMTFLDLGGIRIKHHTALCDGNKPGSQLEQSSDESKAPINI